MTKPRYPRLKDLLGIKVVVSPHVPDDKVVLVGQEQWKDSLHFSRQLSVLDLTTGEVTGSVHHGEVQRIEVSESNRTMFEEAS